MTINARTKGQTGEREIATLLNNWFDEACIRKGYKIPAVEDRPFQRNQNQSAVGGDDLTNPMRLSIEVKRQENLSVPSWWRQCEASARRQNNIPILLFRQNRKSWRCRMLCCLSLDTPTAGNPTMLHGVDAEIEFSMFKHWFLDYANRWLDTEAAHAYTTPR